MNEEPKIYFGVNLNFAKYVYGHKRALDVVKNQIGAHYVEMVPDIDYGPVFFTKSPKQFHAFYEEVAEYAEEIGIGIPTMLTFYRDNASILHSNPVIREHAFTAMRAMAVQAGCLGCDVVGASFGTMLVEDFENKREECVREGVEYWQRWLRILREEGVGNAALETMSTSREPPATISSAKRLLGRLQDYHRRNLSTTSIPGLCYDVGHGASECERDSNDDVNFSAWFKAFPADIIHIHLKNTDPQFLETWPFTGEYQDLGIVNLRRVLRAIRNDLQRETLYVMFEVPGKRGRLIGERESIKANQQSFAYLKKALYKEGFCEDPEEHTWSPV